MNIENIKEIEVLFMPAIKALAEIIVNYYEFEKEDFNELTDFILNELKKELKEAYNKKHEIIIE